MADIERHMENLRQGNLSSIEEIYLLTKNAVYFTALSVLNDKSLAEDIMQDTYIKVCANIHSYIKGTNAKAWIVTISKNLALNLYNRRKFEAPTDYSERTELGPYGEISAKDESGIFSVMKRTLDKNEYEIIMLHVMAGLKFREVADLIDKPQGTVRWQYNNAIKKIQKIMNLKEAEL